ncbi:MAG: nitrate- and nitrite sensing domain-containing protein, partial [Actinocatenispora sp.]
MPILAVVALAGVELATQGQTLVDARQVNSSIRLSNKAGTLIQALQDERLGAAQVLMAQQSDRGGLDDTFRQQSAHTDRTLDQYRSQRDTLKNPPSDLAGNLKVIDNQLTSLSKDVRLEVLSPEDSDATVASVTFRYQVLISELLDLRQSVVKLTNDRVLSDELSANAALSQAKEFAAQEQLALLRVINDGRGFDNTSFESFLGTLTGQQSAYDAFNRTATDNQQVLLQKDVSGPHVQDSTALETDARTGGTGGALSVSASSWNQAMKERITAIHKVEEQLDATAAAHAQAQVDDVVRKVIIESAAGLVVLLVAIILALLVARAMARSLRRLREGALRVAYEGLPQAVSQLRAADVGGGLSAEEIASQVGDPVQVHGRDEIGQVSEAFNVVHREAVRVAAEQAVLRASVSTMFVNLARRSQLLVDRLIGHLDRLEQGEEDPDRLAQLFQLDHLATRMRRNDENLLVLAGADSSRARREAAPLGDVLRAAQSEVEQYTRIEFGVVDRDVEVEATAVNDVVHLVAELLDNATAFSSPDTAVLVDARRVGDRAIVQIEDRGIGMAPEVLSEVNERLAAPPLVDVAVSRMMGLVVVGRLASRLGIRIELRAAPDRGTVADVILPSEVLVAVDRNSRRAASGPGALALETEERRAPAPDPIPGIPYQPSGRDSLADAAGARTRANGSALPQREAAPPQDPELDRPPVRRSLFDPQPRTTPEESSPYDQPEEEARPAASWSTDAGATPRRDTRPSVADSLRPRRSRTEEPSEASTSGQWHLPREEQPSEASTSGQWHLPREDDGAAARSSGAEQASPVGSGLPRRAVPEPSSDWRESANTGVHDSTVETPQVAASDSWPRRESSSGSPAPRRTPARSTEGAAEPGRLDSAGPGQPSSGSGRTEIIPRNVDDTMELPIFREVESAWFRTSPSRPRTPAASGKPPAPAPNAS